MRDAPVGRRPVCWRVPRWALKECGAALRAGCRRVRQCAGEAQLLTPANAGLGGLPNECAALGGSRRRASCITSGAGPEKRAGCGLENDVGEAALGTPPGAPQAKRSAERRLRMPSSVRQPQVVLTVARTHGVFVGRGGRGRAAFSAPARGLPAVGFAPPGYGRVSRETRFLPVVSESLGPHCTWRWGASPAGAGVVAPRFRMALHAGSRGGQSLAVLPVARTRGVFVGRSARGRVAFSAAAGGLRANGFAPPE